MRPPRSGPAKAAEPKIPCFSRDFAIPAHLADGGARTLRMRRDPAEFMAKFKPLALLAQGPEA